MSIYTGIGGVVKKEKAFGTSIDGVLKHPNLIYAGINDVNKIIYSRIEDAEIEYFYIMVIAYRYRKDIDSSYVSVTKSEFQDLADLYYIESPAGPWNMYLKPKVKTVGAAVSINIKFSAKPIIGANGNYCSYGTRFTQGTPFSYTIRNLTSANLTTDSAAGWVYTRFNGLTSLTSVGSNSGAKLTSITKQNSSTYAEMQMMTNIKIENASSYKAATLSLPTTISFNSVDYPFKISGVEKR